VASLWQRECADTLYFFKYQVTCRRKMMLLSQLRNFNNICQHIVR
jgi:hypothetical protein